MLTGVRRDRKYLFDKYSVIAFLYLVKRGGIVLMVDDIVVSEHVIRIVAEILNIPVDRLGPDTSLRRDLQVDSLQQMTLFIVLEDEFHLTIPPEEVTELDTIEQVVDFITMKIKQKSVA